MGDRTHGRTHGRTDAGPGAGPGAGTDHATGAGTARATPGPTGGAPPDPAAAGAPAGSAADGSAADGSAADGSAADGSAADGSAAAHAAEHNRLLRALPLAEYARLLPRLTPVALGLKQVLIEPDAPIRDVYFPRSGVGSMIADGQAGGAVEVGTIGPEGFIGLPVLMGADRMPYRVFVQVAGDGWRLPADAFRRLVDERAPVRRLLLRFAQTFSDQVAQSVACNRLHAVDERCARWLLMTHDRVHGDAFELTHEFLSLMLGVRRAGVTVAMGALQGARIIRYVRGRVAVLDRPRLEAAACGCYHITRAASDRLLG
jgi:CRP-like cAMP-binding protein